MPNNRLILKHIQPFRSDTNYPLSEPLRGAHIQEWRRRRRSLGEPLLFFIGSKPSDAEHGKNDVEKHIVV
jgi:hypothetical protein